MNYPSKIASNWRAVQNGSFFVINMYIVYGVLLLYD